MFKRFIARLLVFFQLYGVVFQSVLHADILDHCPVRSEVYLHGSIRKTGELHLTLGTDAISGHDLEVLKHVEIPSYQTLKGYSKPFTIEVIPSSKPSLSYFQKFGSSKIEVIVEESERESDRDSDNENSSDKESDKESPASDSDRHSEILKLHEKPVTPNSAFSGGVTVESDSELELDEDVTDDAPDLLNWQERPNSPSSAFSDRISEESDSELEQDQDEELAAYFKDGLTRVPEGVYFNLQGLQVFMKNDGDILIEGTQTDFSRPIFISGDRKIDLKNVQASTLQLSSSYIVSSGICKIDSLILDGVDQHSTFLNTGELTATEFFLKNINSANTGKITAPQFSIEGELESAGSIESSELILEEGAFLKLLDGSNATLKSVFLCQASRVENHLSETLKLDVLDGLGGTFTNMGNVHVGEVPVDSKFQAILNRNAMTISKGDIKAGQFENTGSWIHEQGALTVEEGNNAGDLIVKELSVQRTFLNALEGVVFTPKLSGRGSFDNLGGIVSETAFEIGIKELTNNGSIGAATITGTTTLEKLTNKDDKNITASRDLSFTSATRVINEGLLKADHQMILVGEKTLHTGTLQSKNLTLVGAGAFENQGDIEVIDQLALNLERLINKSSIEAKSILGSALLNTLENSKEASISLTGGTLKTLAQTSVINHGAITGGKYEFSGPQFMQRGELRGESLTLSGSGEFLNLRATEISGAVSLNLPRFINKHALKAGSITGSASLSYLENVFDASIILEGGLFKIEGDTVFKNRGLVTGGAYEFLSGTLDHKGVILGQRMTLGMPEFHNDGMVDISGAVTLNGERFFNSEVFKAGSIEGSRNLKYFRNYSDSLIHLKGGILKTNKGTVLVNYGSITGGIYKFYGAQVDQVGILKGDSLEVGWDTLFITGNDQKTTMTGDIRISNLDWLEIRGKTSAINFTYHGEKLGLHGELTLASDFDGGGIIHPSAKLTARSVDFSENTTIHGEVKAKFLSSEKNLTNNGKVSVQTEAVVHGELNVLVGATLEGFKGDKLSLDVKGKMTVAGLVDMDELNVDALMSVARGGKVLSQKSAKFASGLVIAEQGTAQLKGLKITGGSLTNAGDLTVGGLETEVSELNFVNDSNGTATVDITKTSTTSAAGLKMRLLNKSGGQLTLKGGKLDLTGQGGFLNQGILVQENERIRWSTPWSGYSPINTGEWHFHGGARLENYTGEAMGKLFVNGVLQVESLVDGIEALGGLTEVETLKNTKVEVHAPVVRTKRSFWRRTKQFAWPLKMVIAGDFDNAIDIKAPELAIQCHKLTSTGCLFSDQAILEIDVRNAWGFGGDMDIATKIGGRDGVKLHAGKLKVSGRADKVGAPERGIKYRRSGNGIYADGGTVKIDIDGDFDNSFGHIKGPRYEIKARRLINRAGLIRAMEPSYRSSIEANIENIRETPGTATDTIINRGSVYGSGRCTICDGKPGSSGCNPFLEHRSSRTENWENSEEGVIEAAGDLLLSYGYLEMMSSRIVCGKDLTFVSGGRGITYYGAGKITQFPGTVRTQQPPRPASYVAAKERIRGNLGDDVDMTCAFTARDISIRALQATFRNLGFQQSQRGMVVNLLTTMRGPNAENVYVEEEDGIYLDLPSYRQPIPKTVVVLGKNANRDTKDSETIDLQSTVEALHHAMGAELFTLYRGISALGIKMEDLLASKVLIDFVRSHRNTQSHRRLIKAGDREKEVEVLSNEVITPEDLMKSGIVSVFLEFTQNIHSLENERQAARDARRLDRETANMFTKVSVNMVIPESEKQDGFRATDGNVSIKTEDDLNVFTNVRATKHAELISTRGVTTFGSAVERVGGGENFHDVFHESSAEADTINIDGYAGVSFVGAKTKSRGRTDIKSTAGPIINEALAAQSQKVERTSTKNSSTTTTTTHIRQHVGFHESVNDTVNMDAATGIYQAGTKNINVTMKAPIIEQEAVHDQHFVHSVTTSTKKSGWFGGTARKSSTSNSTSSTARGSENRGRIFIAKAKELYKATMPTFGAQTNTVTADKIKIAVGQNRSQSGEQSTSQGTIWNKTKITRENHTTHVNPKFENNVYLYSPQIIIEKVQGSPEFTNIISDSKIKYVDKADQHEVLSKSQKSLSAGMQLLIKATTVAAMMFATPASGFFNLAGAQASMVNAGFAALCSDAAVNLVENGGDPAKAIKAMGRNGTALNVGRAMLTTGLVTGVSELAGLTPQNVELLDYAKKAAVNAAVNTVLAVGIDGQDFKGVYQENRQKCRGEFSKTFLQFYCLITQM